jgi:hypothetical protein
MHNYNLTNEEKLLILDFIGCAYQEGYNGDSDLYNTDNTKQMIISIGKKLGFTDNEIEEITDCHIL